VVETAAVAMEMETEAAVKAVVGWEREARVEEGTAAEVMAADVLEASLGG
jgi:hypothetical protein